jgi:endonuclease YncB( thermonuclease family)
MRPLSRPLLLIALGLLLALAATAGAAKLPPGGQLARIAYVVDGDTVELGNGERVRLVQIDTPEVYNSLECYGESEAHVRVSDDRRWGKSPPARRGARA